MCLTMLKFCYFPDPREGIIHTCCSHCESSIGHKYYVCAECTNICWCKPCVNDKKRQICETHRLIQHPIVYQSNYEAYLDIYLYDNALNLFLDELNTFFVQPFTLTIILPVPLHLPNICLYMSVQS